MACNSGIIYGNNVRPSTDTDYIGDSWMGTVNSLTESVEKDRNSYR